MPVSLKGMSRKQLEQLRDRVDAKLAKIDNSNRKEALAAAEKAAKALGFSLNEILGKNTAGPKKQRAAKKPKVSSPPKFANPDDPSQTWTGKGRQPQWFKDAMSAGKKPDDLAI